jgi:Glycosyl transferase family 2
MLPAPLRRIRSVLGARLHLLQTQYEAAARATDLRPSIDRLGSTLEEWRTRESEQMLAQRQELAELRAAVTELQENQTKHLRLSRAAYDGIGDLRQKLIALRRSDSYAATFENRHPLVSVPIATFNAAELLVDRTIASVRSQTYDRWEIVVVGDGCTDDTATRVARLGDPRIRFVNLPFRAVYPNDPHERWLVAGGPPWNRAIELCRGEWISPLDDDDELLPNHMKTLLDLALERRAEYAYGTLEQVAEPGAEPFIFSFPPELGRIGLQQALYLRGLSFFESDIYSWAMDEPADWNIIRRMRDAGVRMEATEEPVARHYLRRDKRAWAL